MENLKNQVNVVEKIENFVGVVHFEKRGLIKTFITLVNWLESHDIEFTMDLN